MSLCSMQVPSWVTPGVLTSQVYEALPLTSVSRHHQTFGSDPVILPHNTRVHLPSASKPSSTSSLITTFVRSKKIEMRHSCASSCRYKRQARGLGLDAHSCCCVCVCVQRGMLSPVCAKVQGTVPSSSLSCYRLSVSWCWTVEGRSETRGEVLEAGHQQLLLALKEWGA
jgi:hypothetical protein